MALVFTYESGGGRKIYAGSRIGVVVATWTSDASGDATGTTGEVIGGLARRFVTNPDGTAVPSDNYDVTVADADGVSLVGTSLNDRDTATTEQHVPTQPVAVASKLTVTVSNAGASKSGVLRIYLS